MIVDFHTHIVPDALPEAPGDGVGWPVIKKLGDEDAEIVIEGRTFRRIDRRSWDAAARLMDMDRDGIDVQVLSPMPELLSYWFAPNVGARICDAVNDHLLKMEAVAPKRFRTMGIVPLQDPAKAVRTLRELRRSGMIGVEIGSHVVGRPLGDPALAPFFAAAEEEGMTVMVHALHPAGVERIGGAPDMAAAAVFPLETALAATSLMVSGVMERHPGLKVLLCHGGGALQAILPRLDHAWQCGLSLASTMVQSPSDIARQFFYDTIVYGQGPFDLLSASVGAERIVMGSDYPFAVMQPDPVSFVRRVSPDAADAILPGPAGLLETGGTRS
ncbi:MAG: amidohydrolase [Marinosulfonomonas sp.]|nr:amidohydrolase [Marinosulfonomonas sp.]